ncbi:uncharacterized protein [Nicotiana sylvestris]|uniref:uncharacterized protein n=1 Tax=Nicotiana sylvestris TaxID=4096 RepID=UPI00388C35A4
MELPPVSDDWAVQAFTQGLNEPSSVALKQLKQNLVEYPVVTWSDVHNRYQSKIKVEDDQLGAPSGSVYPSRVPANEPRPNKERYQQYTEDRRNAPRRNIPRNDRRTDRGQNPRGLSIRAIFDRHTRPTEAPGLSEYNFNVDVSDIVSAIGKIRETRCPRPILLDPSQKNHNLVCEFHGRHDHRTEDCRQLREEVARLLKKGHLREFLSDRDKNQFQEREANRKNESDEPKHVIHMIVGGIDIPQEPIAKRTKISIPREKQTWGYIPEEALTFNDEDIETLSQPHNDALVISFLMNTFQIKRMSVDPGSSANIIRSRVVEQLGLLDQVMPTSRVLNGFNMVSETTKGDITIPVNMASTTQNVKFHVIEGDMRYNTLLGRPWIHCMRAVPSTLHQIMKFLTEDGIKTVYRE